MNSYIYLILLLVLGLHIYCYKTRITNLDLVKRLLSDIQVHGTYFWGQTITGYYRGRHVQIYTHTKATLIYMAVKPKQFDGALRVFSSQQFVFFWSRVNDHVTHKDGILYYRGLGWQSWRLYFARLSAPRALAILEELSVAAQRLESAAPISP